MMFFKPPEALFSELEQFCGYRSLVSENGVFNPLKALFSELDLFLCFRKLWNHGKLLGITSCMGRTKTPPSKINVRTFQQSVG